jgi:hypothetical protein
MSAVAADVIETQNSTNAITAYREKLRQELANLSNRVAPPSGNKISLKGKVFKTPDGKVSPGPLRAVVLDWRTERNFYKGTFNPNQIEPPICWGLDRDIVEAPHDKVTKAQATNCGSCPHNQYGSAPNGKGKACREYRRLAIVPANATVASDVMIIQVSPTGLRHFDNFVLGLGAGPYGKSTIETVTEISFDPAQDYPTLRFTATETLDDEHLEIMMTLREKAQPSLDREPTSAS